MVRTIAKFYDTCALLDSTWDKDLFNESFYISSVTLHELEHIKTSRNKDEETRFKARKLTHLLDENHDKYQTVVFNQDISQYIETGLGLDSKIPDNQILGTAKYVDTYTDLVFYTNDICLKNIARSLELEVQSTNIRDECYTGYIERSLSEKDMAYFYEHVQENTFGLIPNQYLILRDEEDNVVDKFRWDGHEYQNVKFKSFKSAMLGNLKPLDEVQSFAMDSICNNPITVLYGKAGSGKTTLPLSYAMQEIEKGKCSKCYIVYSFEPLRGAKTLGFEKGDHLTKLLYYSSIGTILANKFGDLQQVEYMVNKGMLEIIPTANIRGIEFASDSILLVTEAQNLDVYTIKTIIQRCKDGCKQIYEGDILEQRDTAIRDFGMERLIDVFKGHKKFGCVKLKNNYRSELSDLADKM